MDHVALPLKYRPMTFDDVVGQAHVVETLRHALSSGRVANAYLFVGPRGIGKTTLSRIFAKALNCQHPEGGGKNAAPTGDADISRGGRNAAPTGDADTSRGGRNAAPTGDADISRGGKNAAPTGDADTSRGGIPAAPTVEPCGECINCREIAAGRSIDVTELDAASHNGVEDVRPIIEQAQFAPTNSKYKIYIIDECHMLSKSAWNALLKTLEEPPPHVRFIFATTEGDKVLETIVSRCQRFDLRRILTHDIVGRLKHICGKEKIDAEEDALLAIARGADGGMRDALTSLDQLVSFCGSKITEEDALAVFGLVSRRALEDLAGAVLTGDTATILSSIETFDSAGKNMRRLAAELLVHFRNLVVVQALGAKTDALTATPDQIRVLEEQAKTADAGRVFRICDQLADLDAKLRETLSVRTILEMTLLRAARIASTATIEELMRAVKTLRGEGARQEARDASAGEGKRQEARDASAGEGKRQEARDASGDTRQETVSLRLAPLPPPQSSPSPQPQPPQTAPSAHPILEDDKLNDIMKMFPGSTVVDVKERKR